MFTVCLQQTEPDALQYSEIYCIVLDLRIPPRCKWDIYWYEMLNNADLQLVSDVSENLRWVTSQKREYLIFYYINATEKTAKKKN
jgi:hypothetical protein